MPGPEQTAPHAPESLGGDTPAIPDPTDWIRRHQRGVWRYLRSLGSSPSTADDLTQEVFLLALDKGFQDRGAAQAWTFLRRTARNLWLGQQRSDRRRAEALADAVDVLWRDRLDTAGSTPGDPNGDHRVEAMRRCLDTLQPRATEVVGLFYRDGLSRADVATRMGLKETGVKTLLQRVRAALKNCMEGTA